MSLRRVKAKSRSSSRARARARARLRFKPRTIYWSVIEKIKTIIRDRT